MGLLAPWFLLGAAVVALPVYLHLLRRHRSDPRPFSSLMFFERRTQSSIKHRRLRYLLLLSLRVALLLLLALAFADPFIRRPAAGGTGHKLRLLVIDNSFSMRAGSRLADARREALSVLASRRPTDRAEVMTLASQIQALTQPTEDTAALRAAVESVEPGDSRANFGELARAVRLLSEGAGTPIELHFFSDMQKSGMPPSFAEMALPASVSLVPHAVVDKVEPNWTVESVDAPGQVFDPKKATVRAVVAGYHTPAASRSVSLVVNGKIIATRNVQVPANGRATAEFPTLDVPYGLSRCEVRIDSADSLPADDVALFGVQRSDPGRVLFIHQPDDSRSPFYFGTALESATQAGFKLETVTLDKATASQLSNYAFVVLSDLLSVPRSFEESLLEYVRRGGGVLLAAGTSTARATRVPLFDENVLGSHDYSRDGSGFLTVGQADRSHPSIANADGWAGVKFYFATRVNDTNSQVIARLADQTPLLLEKHLGEGRVLLLTSGLDNLTNDFPLHPAFLPFVEQTARYMSGLETSGSARVVDSVFELRSGKQPATSVQVIGPDGRQALSLDQSVSAQTFPLTRAGFYGFRRANGHTDLVGVNPDRRESDLDVMPDDVVSLWRAGSSGRGEAGASGAAPAESRSRDLWWYVMLLLLAAAVAESLLASRYLGELREGP
ncbi:MAG TPA: BatA domain-containing protein [Terriglobia bacterium]|nr:BatA domain-containing protein [Terriglobia bacterium]